MQPDDPGQSIVENHYHENGSHKIVWGAAALFGATLLTICGVALAKVYELGERMAKVETIVEYIAKQR